MSGSVSISGSLYLNGVNVSSPNLSGYVTTSSFNAFTGSINTWTGSINTFTGSINTFTGSINTFTGSINTFTGYINTFTGSINTFTGSINTFTGSINTFTGSMNTFTGSINTWTGSLSYKTNIGNGTATNIGVTHGLNTKDIIVQLYDNSTFETVWCDVVRTDVNYITCSFSQAPTTNQYRVVILKA
jgi:hypothetical protein